MKVDSKNCGLVDAVQSGWYNMESGELMRGFKVSADDVVFDYGCGVGAATMFCANQGAHVIFSDVEEVIISRLEQQVKETKAREIQSLLIESPTLPIADSFATKIISMEVLEHVDDPSQTLAELNRIAKPGAQFLLTVPASEGELLQKNIAPDSYFEKPNHLRIFSTDDFKNLVTDAGLEIELYTTWGFYWTLWMSFYWVSQQNLGAEVSGAVLDNIKPPFHPLLDSWATTWQRLIDMPEGQALKEKLDRNMPKTQTIIARKAA